MFLSNFSVRKPLATTVLVVITMTLGLLAMSKLRVNQNPDVEIPGLFVRIPYPGASPDTVEREIVNRLEKSLQAVPGVTELYAYANEGGAGFEMLFSFNKNMIEASDEVRNVISSIRYKLPLEMREPTLQRFDPSQRPVIRLAISSSSQSHAEISRFAEDYLANRIRAIPGVASVNVSGALRRELSILLHAKKLREFNISVSDVVTAVKSQNTNAPVGKIRSNLEEESIRIVGRIESPAEFRDIIVKQRGDHLVHLGQVATIEDGFAEVNDLSIRSGKHNVGIQVIRSREASTVSVSKEVIALTEEINNELKRDHPGTFLKVTFDGGAVARDSLNNVIESLIFGAVLTIFIVYMFLNSWRSTLITALSLPTSVIAAFIAVWLCGFTLNFMTLLGLSLAIGVLIDDAIVVRENIERHMQNGADRRSAALEGTAEIGMAVTATTFSIVSVFIPVAFMPGVAGEWFRPFALTVTCSVLVSLLISFTLDPMLSAYWGDPTDHQSLHPTGLKLVLKKFNRWFDEQAGYYGNLVAWALKHHRWMVAIAIFVFIGALILQSKLGGTSFLPTTDSGDLIIEVRTPASSSLDYARLKMERAAEIARTVPEVKETNSNISASGGRIYLDIGKKNTRKRTAKEIAVEIREKIQPLVGAEFVVMDDLSNGAGKPVQIEFTGPDSRKLLEITIGYMEQLRKIPGIVDIGLSEQDPKKELRIEITRGLASSMGISIDDTAQSLRVAFAGIEVGDWVDPTGETRDVSIRLHPLDRVSKENIELLPLSISGSNLMVPLDQIATITMGKGPSSIEHRNGKRTITVSANVQGRSDGEVINDALELARSFNYPPGYGLSLTGSGQDQDEVFTEMSIALIAGIGLMYLILVVQFSSFTAPLAVMLSLPLSLIGVVIALIITGNTVNLMSLIGVIMLMGLVAKNSILLLDAARKLEDKGINRDEALIQAGQIRLRPILMTTFALIAGMVPVALGVGEGGEFYRPLAIAIIGGTVTSTILTLLVVPSFYDSIELARDRFVAKVHIRARRMHQIVAIIMTTFDSFTVLIGLKFAYRTIITVVRRFR